MDVDLIELAKTLAAGARKRVDEEEKRIDAIIAARNAVKEQSQPVPSR